MYGPATTDRLALDLTLVSSLWKWGLQRTFISLNFLFSISLISQVYDGDCHSCRVKYVYNYHEIEHGPTIEAASLAQEVHTYGRHI